MKKIILSAFAAFSIAGYSQTTTPAATTTAPAVPAVSSDKEWDVSMYGFVRTDYFVDTRRTSNVREYNLNLYPLDVLKDANGKDVNAVPSSNFLSVTSRLGVKVKGPNVWGAKMQGTLEGDFFGNTEGATSSIGLFRLRHAYVNMDWSKTSLLLGQTWVPAFIPEVMPGVANFNTGILFNPFGWATQFRIKQNLTKNISFAFTAYKEREFTTPVVPASTQNGPSTNSVIPSLHGQFQYKGKNVVAGVGAEYKSLQPLIVSNNQVSTEKVTSATVLGYFKYANEKVSFKAYGISGSNTYNLVMLGGFAGYTTPGNVETYKATKTSAFWIDIASMGKKVAPGMFFGYSKNNGTGKDGATAYYVRGISGTRGIDNVWRASARVDFKQNKFRVTPEVEYTAATWGDVTSSGSVKDNTTVVGNFRALVSCVYTF